MVRTDVYNYEVNNPYYQQNNLNFQSKMDPSGLGFPQSPVFDSFIKTTNPTANSSFSTTNAKTVSSVDNTDDGSISFTEKLKCFGKGIISPITSMFSSAKNFAIGASMLVAGGALLVATG
ncbi:MAG: hypothetical protein PHC34_07440 [Candidatus Gastranaerophilales bacterium]|nr:hypothetical protein [Candidatus Gastranaerophilales bacterium]